MIREGNLDSFRNIPRIKTLARTYGKGWVTDTGEVLPFMMHTNGSNNIIEAPEKSYPEKTIDTKHKNNVLKNLKELFR